MNYQSNLFGSYPVPDHCKTSAMRSGEAARSRLLDPETSEAAARSQTVEGMTETKRLILQILREKGPMTDHAIGRWLSIKGHRVSDSGARTRRSSLVDAGLIVDSGERLKLAESGRNATVWKAVG